MPKRSEFATIHSTMQMVRFRFDDGRESTFAGPPLPRDYGAIKAIEFSALLILPPDFVLAVKPNGAIGFLDPREIEDD